MSESDDRYQRVNLRLPRELHARLQAIADRHTRSMNAEIVARLENSLGSIEDRLAALEDLVLSDERGNGALLSKIDREADRLEDLIQRVADRLPRFR